MKLRVKIHNPISIREKVYSAIRSEIFRGRYPRGERVVETQLAKEINTSRTPVREALHMLEREGLLEAIPRVGYKVREIQWNEVQEICEIRAVNEILAARWAMKRITAQEIGALEQNLAIAEKELKSGRPEAFVELDGEFHEILVNASRSKHLMELCQLLRHRMLIYRIESLYLPDPVLGAIRGHRNIINCLKKKDRKGLERAIRDHLEFAKKSIQTHIRWNEVK
jgi:DNA-binding GntR family transcriptional regulator